ncbi:tRNA lysidine(34) synthetase TilS [Pseudoglutamicibacter albus]|uniref:tRNA lysidine(34) synthetase TilS n=1 Tax=Pseudoglutamicibacter albus TaxID=98671 RepID=UPI00360C0344
MRADASRRGLDWSAHRCGCGPSVAGRKRCRRGRAARACRVLGVEQVVVRRVEVPGKGTENDAREARYRELELVREEVGAEFVLTAHTANDQAEQVLLALARGSGTRAIAGIPDRRGRFLRPFLEVWREDTEAVCEAYGVQPWEDPTNTDPEFALRNKVRLELLPEFTRVLGDGALTNLVRTAIQARHDAEHLDNEAEAALQTCALTETPEVLDGPRASGRAPMQWDLDRYLLKNAPQAIRTRVLRFAAQTVGGVLPPQNAQRHSNASLQVKAPQAPSSSTATLPLTASKPHLTTA